MGATVATFTPPWRGAARDQIIVITRLTSCRFVTWINSEEIRILGRKGFSANPFRGQRFAPDI